jgi:hypothetical protein
MGVLMPLGGSRRVRGDRRLNVGGLVSLLGLLKISGRRHRVPLPNSRKALANLEERVAGAHRNARATQTQSIIVSAAAEESTIARAPLPVFFLPNIMAR